MTIRTLLLHLHHRLLRTANVAIATALLGACTANAPPQTSSASSNPTPASYLHADTGCAIVVGGSVGSRFADRQVEAIWYRLNESVSEALFERLVQGGYKVSKLIVPPEQAGELQAHIVLAAASNQCNRVLQVSHHANEDAFGKYFRFDIALLKFAPKGERAPGAAGTNVVLESGFSKRYRFARNQETFAGFHTGSFAQTVFTDLELSRALDTIRNESSKGAP